MIVGQNIKYMQKDMCIRVMDKLQCAFGMASLTKDAWFSRIYKGYLSVTVYWIYLPWELKSTELEFVSFHKPHTASATLSLLYEFMEKWRLLDKVRAIKTDSASKMAPAVAQLLSNFNITGNGSRRVLDFYLRCIAHVVNLAVKDFLQLIHSNIDSV